MGEPMAREKKRRSFWQTMRVYFRRFRIAMLLFVLGLIGLLVYVNQVGLPGFLKQPLLDRLRAEGIDFEYSRLRLRFYQGIVAEGARFGKFQDPSKPQLTAGEVELQLNHEALASGRLQIDGLAIRRGRVSWSIPGPGENQPSRELCITNLETRLRLPGENLWELQDLTAEFAGARFQLSGIITNGAAIRNWSLWKGAGPATPGSGRGRLRHWADILESIHFSAPPELRIDLRGDGSDLNSFNLRILLAAPGAQTPWADVTDGRLFARVDPARGTRRSRARIQVQAASAQTPWASARNFALDLGLQYGVPQSNAVTGHLNCSADGITTRWATAGSARLAADWVHSLTNPIPQDGKLHIDCSKLGTSWAQTEQASFEGNFLRMDQPPQPDPTLGWWTNLQPYALDWSAAATHLESETNRVSQIACAGSWQTPALTISNLHGLFYGRDLDAGGSLDIGTRLCRAWVRTSVDPGRMGPLLPQSAVRWLSQFTWTNPPVATASATLRLAPWTQREPDWKNEVLPSLTLAGQFQVTGGGTYRGLAAGSASAHFYYSNQVWRLPDLQLHSGTGNVSLEHRADERSRDFFWNIQSSLDPKIILPLLGPDEKNLFNLVTLSDPPGLEAELWGNYADPSRTGIRGHICLTNYSFRGDHSDRLEASFQFTNNVLRVFNPRIDRGTQHLSADGVMADFDRQMIHITNGFTDTDPMFVARAIGPHIVKIITPYKFLSPPSVHASGSIPLHGEEGADLTLNIKGGPFHWWKFRLPKINGTLHWLNSSLSIENLIADFYGGQATGSAKFFFREDGDADFIFSTSIFDTGFKPLLSDLTGHTNQLEGVASAHITITSANTTNLYSACGFGDMHLKEGLIWDIPLFGIFSPMLNGITPGLGNSKANAADCTFVMTNGVLRSEDMIIRTAAARLTYKGTVDLDGKLDARVEAGLFHDMRVFGPMVSTVLWPVSKSFEYKVTGTLDQPHLEPVFLIPKLMQLPFLPLKVLKGIFQEKGSPGSQGNPSDTP